MVKRPSAKPEGVNHFEGLCKKGELTLLLHKMTAFQQ